MSHKNLNTSTTHQQWLDKLKADGFGDDWVNEPVRMSRDVPSLRITRRGGKVLVATTIARPGISHKEFERELKRKWGKEIARNFRKASEGWLNDKNF